MNLLTFFFISYYHQVAGIATISKKLAILKVWDGTIPSHKVEPGTYSQVK